MTHFEVVRVQFLSLRGFGERVTWKRSGATNLDLEKKRFSDAASGSGEVHLTGSVIHGPEEGGCEGKIKNENKVTIKKEPSTVEKKSKNGDDGDDEDMTLLDMVSEKAGSHLQMVVFAGEPSSSTDQPQKTNSDSAPSNGAGKSDANMEDGSRDITQLFLPRPSVQKKASSACNKTRFLASDLIVPGISLKKMKVAMESSPESRTLMAWLGQGHVTMYKTERVCLHGMTILDASLHVGDALGKACKNLEKTPLIALMLPANSSLDVGDVACFMKIFFGLTKCYVNCTGVGAFFFSIIGSIVKDTPGTSKTFHVDTAQALQVIPPQCSLGDEIFVFQVPANEGLGAKEHDFANVTASMVSKEGELLPKQPNVEYFGTGKLGTLKGGLSNAMDFRERMSNTDIAVLAETSVEQAISVKRTDYGFSAVSVICCCKDFLRTFYVYSSSKCEEQSVLDTVFQIPPSTFTSFEEHAFLDSGRCRLACNVYSLPLSSSSVFAKCEIHARDDVVYVNTITPKGRKQNKYMKKLPGSP